MKKGNDIGKYLSLVGVVLLLVLALVAQKSLNSYVLQVLSMFAINVIFAVSFNLIYGFTGQFSLAHAGVAAIGGYTLALLALTPAQKATYFVLQAPIWPINVLHWPFIPTLILAGILAMLVGILIAGPALRLRGDYLLIVTLGFSEIIRLVICNVPSICNAALGLKAIPRQASLVWYTAIAVFVVFAVKRLVDSSYGTAMKSIRDDEIAASALGINLFRHKLLAFAISCFFVGIGGALFIDLLGAIDPGTFRPALTFSVLTMVVLGGVGSITGSVLGAGVYTIMSEVLRPLEYSRVIMGIKTPDMPGLRMLVFAAMLIIIMLYRRSGLMGTKELSWDALLSKSRTLLNGKQGRRMGS